MTTLFRKYSIHIGWDSPWVCEQLKNQSLALISRLQEAIVCTVTF